MPSWCWKRPKLRRASVSRPYSCSTAKLELPWWREWDSAKEKIISAALQNTKQNILLVNVRSKNYGIFHSNWLLYVKQSRNDALKQAWLQEIPVVWLQCPIHMLIKWSWCIIATPVMIFPITHNLYKNFCFTIIKQWQKQLE